MSANFVAGANAPIYPSTFVVMDTANPKAVNPATGTSTFIVGVSQEYCAQAPVSGATLTAAAATGDMIKVYGNPGETCLLFSTTAGWTQGARLTSNASGYGVAATSGQQFGAIALVSISGAGLGQVQIVQGVV